MSEDNDVPLETRQDLMALRASLARLEAASRDLHGQADWQRVFCEAANEGLWAIDADARTIYANAKMAQMLGTTVDELIGSSLFDFVDERDAATCRANIERRRRGVSEEHRFDFLRRDGKRVSTTLRTAPIIDSDGAYRGSAAFVTDVTESRRAEEELRRQKDDFRLIFDSAPEMIWFKDAENRILRVNQRAAEYSGLEVSEVEGRSAYELFPAQAAAYHKDDLEVIRSNRSKRGIIEPIVGAKGETRWIRTDKFPCRDACGEAVGVVVFALDITDSKLAADALAASEKRYRDLVETSHDLIWSVDAQGRWTFVNRAATLRIYGREPEELLGHPFAELESSEQQKLDLEVFERILAGRSYFEYETVHMHKSGAPIHLSFNAIVLRDAQGNVIGSTGTAKDITERKRAEAEREQLNAKLLQTQKLESLGVLAGGIAHDFNNLLVGILGNAGLALMDLPPESPARESIEGVRDAGQRAAELVRQLLAYSGRGKFVIERLDLPRMVDEMVHLLSAVISKKAVLKIETPSGLPPVEGDPTQIRQVLMNLITNASDAIGDRGGTITVTTGVMQADESYLASTYLHEQLTPGTFVFVEVSDTGCGMDAETLARIFEPFYTTKFAGRGLGLSAVLGILRGHRGAIRVSSQPGCGTTMRILLPASGVSHPAGAAHRAVQSASDAEWRGKGTVLIVDDEEIVRTVTKNTVGHAGFQAVLAEDGHVAVARFREHYSDIVAVLLDMTMPSLSGAETLEELRRIDPNVRVILTSGYSEQDAARTFAGRGLAGFVRKPCLPGELLATLRAALEG